MNILLWVLQVALAWLCVGGGVFQIFKIEQLQKGVAAMRAVPESVWAVFGTFSCVAGVCLIVPGVIRLVPIATPIAAAAVAVESAIISALYVYYGDRSPLPFSIAMVLMGAFIAYGRFVLKPL